MAISITHAVTATLPNDPSKEVSSDAWNDDHTVSGLATVAETGAYADLTGSPALATVATSGLYSDLTGSPTVPTLVSQLVNDSSFISAAGAPVQSVAGRTGTVTLVKGDVGLGNVDNTADTAKPVSTAQQSALDLKANLAGPTFTGTVAGITKSMVGLANVDNTTDAGKPVSTAQQTALDLKANLAGPTFSGNITLNAQSIVTDTTTGLKIGTATNQKLGFFNVTPVVQITTYTQTFSTASKTVPAQTSADFPAGGTGVAAGGWSTAANRDLAITRFNALRVDVDNVKKVVNQLIDDLQSIGLIA